MTGRNTLSLESVKAQKVVLSGIRAAGGAHLVLISANLLNSVNMAHSRKVADDKEKAVANRKAEEAAAGKQAGKFCTLLRKVVHYTILFGQEWLLCKCQHAQRVLLVVWPFA